MGATDDDPWAAELAASPIGAWRGTAWRFHRRRYAADDPSGSLRFPGRFHRGWPALYLSLRSHVAQGEISRHLTRDTFPLLRDAYRLTEFRVVLEDVHFFAEPPDFLDSTLATISGGDLCRDVDFAAAEPIVGQRLAAAAFDRGTEGILVPSCTGYAGGNLVLFPGHLRHGSRVDIVRSEDPTLYVER